MGRLLRSLRRAFFSEQRVARRQRPRSIFSSVLALEDRQMLTGAWESALSAVVAATIADVHEATDKANSEVTSDSQIVDSEIDSQMPNSILNLLTSANNLASADEDSFIQALFGTSVSQFAGFIPGQSSPILADLSRQIETELSVDGGTWTLDQIINGMPGMPGMPPPTVIGAHFRKNFVDGSGNSQNITLDWLLNNGVPTYTFSANGTKQQIVGNTRIVQSYGGSGSGVGTGAPGLFGNFSRSTVDLNTNQTLDSFSAMFLKGQSDIAVQLNSLHRELNGDTRSFYFDGTRGSNGQIDFSMDGMLTSDQGYLEFAGNRTNGLLKTTASTGVVYDNMTGRAFIALQDHQVTGFSAGLQFKRPSGFYQVDAVKDATGQYLSAMGITQLGPGQFEHWIRTNFHDVNTGARWIAPVPNTSFNYFLGVDWSSHGHALNPMIGLQLRFGGRIRPLRSLFDGNVFPGYSAPGYFGVP